MKWPYLCVNWGKLLNDNISKTLWSLGCIPVKTVCSMSTVMPCVDQQTFPATICQHPFGTLFRKPFTNSKWKSSWWLPEPHARYCYLDSSNGQFWLYSWLLNSTLRFCCVQGSPLRIMPMATLQSARSRVYITEMNPNSTHIWLFIPGHQSQINILFLFFLLCCASLGHMVSLLNYRITQDLCVIFCVKGLVCFGIINCSVVGLSDITCNQYQD